MTMSGSLDSRVGFARKISSTAPTIKHPSEKSSRVCAGTQTFDVKLTSGRVSSNTVQLAAAGFIGEML